MNILFFTELSPFPINGGERIRSYGLIKALSNLGYNLIVVLQNEDQVNLNDYYINNVEFIEYKQEKSKLDIIFRTEFFLKNKKVNNIFDKILDINKIDCVILEFYLAGRYVSYFKKKNIPVIIGTHNYQSYFSLQRTYKTAFGFFRKYQEYFLMVFHERFFYKKADGIIVVSDLDYDFHKKFISEDKLFLIPNFLDENRYVNNFKREGYIVMTGNFDAYMNYEGLKWFINNVWSTELDELFELKLVGKNSIKHLNTLLTGKDFKNIKALGMVADITPYICKAKLSIIPLLHGSGTRLKCIEAMALKTPLISTNKGVEGVKTNSIILADTSNEFREALKDFTANMETGDRLYKDFIKNYSLKANMPRIKEMLEVILMR